MKHASTTTNSCAKRVSGRRRTQKRGARVTHNLQARPDLVSFRVVAIKHHDGVLIIEVPSAADFGRPSERAEAPQAGLRVVRAQQHVQGGCQCINVKSVTDVFDELLRLGLIEIDIEQDGELEV